VAEQRELTCQELVELVTDYLEGVLPPGDTARFEAHLVDCEDCTAYLEQMGQTILALGRLPVEAVPPAAMAELLSRFREWRTGY
jgi:predicted anti-sigma-YlaC factor YlaD